MFNSYFDITRAYTPFSDTPTSQDPLEKRSSSSGQTPLHAAAFAGQLAAVQFLVEAKAEPWRCTVDGRTPCLELVNLSFQVLDVWDIQYGGFHSWGIPQIVGL